MLHISIFSINLFFTIITHCIVIYETLRSSGLSTERDQQLVSHPDVRGVEDWKRHVLLLLDEMHIKEDLVYNKHNGALVGFVNLTDITVHLEEFERSLTNQAYSLAPPTLANSLFMVRVLFYHDSNSIRPVHLPKSNWRTDLPNLLGSSVQDRAESAESTCNYFRWSGTEQEIFRAA